MPAAVPTLSRVAFFRLFTAAERTAIRGSADPGVRDMLYLAEHAEVIDLADPDVVAGVRHLAALGILTEPRAQAVLAGMAPGA